MDMNLSKLLETVKDRDAWSAAVHGVTKSQTQLSDWTTTTSTHGVLFSLNKEWSGLASPEAPGKESTCDAGDLQETWVWFLFQEDPLEEEMATYSGILAWEIPWTEERGGLQSMGLQTVRHNWATKQQQTKGMKY